MLTALKAAWAARPWLEKLVSVSLIVGFGAFIGWTTCDLIRVTAVRLELYEAQGTLATERAARQKDRADSAEQLARESEHQRSMERETQQAFGVLVEQATKKEKANVQTRNDVLRDWPDGLPVVRAAEVSVTGQVPDSGPERSCEDRLRAARAGVEAVRTAVGRIAETSRGSAAALIDAQDLRTSFELAEGSLATIRRAQE